MVGPWVYGVFEGRHVDRRLASRAGWRADVLRGRTGREITLRFLQNRANGYYLRAAALVSKLKTACTTFGV